MELATEQLPSAADVPAVGARTGVDEFARVAASVAVHGWPDGFNRVLPELPQTRLQELHREFWTRHAGWKGLFCPARRHLAVVFEAAYGSAAIALTEDFDKVVVVVPDASHGHIVRARADWLQIRNLDVVEACALTDAADAIVVYGYDAATSRAIVDGCAKAPWRTAHSGLFVGIKPASRIGRAAHALYSSSIRRSLQRHFPVVEQLAFDRALVDSSELTAGDSATLRQRVGTRLAPWRRRGVAFAARGAADDVTLFEAVRRAVQQHCRSVWKTTASLRIDRRLFSTPEGFSLMLSADGAPSPLIVRIAMNTRTTERFRANFERLVFLRDELGRIDTPLPLLTGDVAGTSFFVESMLPGSPLRDHLGGAHGEEALGAAIRWIQDLHQQTARTRLLTDSEVNSLIIEPVAGAFAFLGRSPGDRGCGRIQHYLAKAFAGEPIPLVMAHGDFSVDNVLVGAGARNVTGVFDWDLSAPADLPLLDVLYLLISADAAAGGRSFAECAERVLAAGDESSSAIDAAVRRYCATLGIPHRLMMPLSILTWAFHLSVRIKSTEPYDWPRNEREFEGTFLESLLRRIPVDPAS